MSMLLEEDSKSGEDGRAAVGCADGAAGRERHRKDQNCDMRNDITGEYTSQRGGQSAITSAVRPMHFKVSNQGIVA